MTLIVLIRGLQCCGSLAPSATALSLIHYLTLLQMNANALWWWWLVDSLVKVRKSNWSPALVTPNEIDNELLIDIAVERAISKLTVAAALPAVAWWQISPVAEILLLTLAIFSHFHIPILLHLSPYQIRAKWLTWYKIKGKSWWCEVFMMIFWWCQWRRKIRKVEREIVENKI